MPRQVREVLDEHADATGRRAAVSSLGMFGNPLQEVAHAEGWRQCIDASDAFGCGLVCGFAEALEDRPTGSRTHGPLPAVEPLGKQPADGGVRLAFENCDRARRGTARAITSLHAPAAWQRMFDALPLDNIGLEWEPCHQMNSPVDPLPQLRQWAHKVFHVHGKDATIKLDVLRTHGLRGGKNFVQPRTPGFGDTNWSDIISILRKNDFRGFIDIEVHCDSYIDADPATATPTSPDPAMSYAKPLKSRGLPPELVAFVSDTVSAPGSCPSVMACPKRQTIPPTNRSSFILVDDYCRASRK